MNTFNYLLGFGGSTRKVMITFRKDGELDPIAVQRAIGEAGCVRDDWRPTIEEYTEVLCQYVAKKCGCEYSCAWADFATNMHIDWADSETACEECPLRPYCPNYEGDDDHDDCFEGCCECDSDCASCPCENREECGSYEDEDEDENEVTAVALFKCPEGTAAINLTCYGADLTIGAVCEVLSKTTNAITKSGLALSLETYTGAIVDAIETNCNCEVIAEYADIAMVITPAD